MHPILGLLNLTEEPVSEEIIERYRESGDQRLRDVIIKSYIRLVLGMAGQYTRRALHNGNADFYNRFEEMSGVACHALTQAVIWSGPHVDTDGNFQPSRLHDNNIEPYIKATVRGWLLDSIAESRTVSIPGKVYRRKLKTGEIDPEGKNTTSALRAVLALVSFQDLEDDRSVIIPIARQEEPELAVEEFLQLAVHDERERRVIDLRREGHSYATIADLLGCSTSTIGKIVQLVERRFDQFYA